MTPLQIDILLHYYGAASDYRDGDFSAPAVRDAIEGFERDQLLVPAKARDGFAAERGQVYVIAERGRVYVEALCDVPLPERRWVMPDRTEIRGAPGFVLPADLWPLPIGGLQDTRPRK